MRASTPPTFRMAAPYPIHHRWRTPNLAKFHRSDDGDARDAQVGSVDREPEGATEALTEKAADQAQLDPPGARSGAD
jgi:hypothetical protein